MLERVCGARSHTWAETEGKRAGAARGSRERSFAYYRTEGHQMPFNKRSERVEALVASWWREPATTFSQIFARRTFVRAKEQKTRRAALAPGLKYQT